MEKKYMHVDALMLDEQNARVHDQRNIKNIADSLKRSGQRKPIIVYKNKVIAGNGTLLAARSLGWSEVWVNDDPFKNDSEAKAYAIADNRTGELASWDFPRLEEALEELAAYGYDREEMGFNDEKWDLSPNLDDVEENLDGIVSTIKVKCPQEIKDEVFIYLKAKILETSFEGVEIV